MNGRSNFCFGLNSFCKILVIFRHVLGRNKKFRPLWHSVIVQHSSWYCENVFIICIIYSKIYFTKGRFFAFSTSATFIFLKMNAKNVEYMYVSRYLTQVWAKLISDHIRIPEIREKSTSSSTGITDIWVSDKILG